ncbi:MAG TPA: hypothetical protein VJT73_05300 [Polyangiaceae bacterium]|nr:hypothetical protein [Polyangiaceae bacterium]
MHRALLPLALGLVLAGCKKSPPPPTPDSPIVKVPLPKASEPARCVPASHAPFVLGPSDTGRVGANAGNDAGFMAEEILPFAAEVGDAVAWAGGFAVGAVHESEKARAVSVVTLDADGKNGKVISLGAAHGDIEPPRLAARGSLLVVGVLEPEPNGRSLRLAKIDSGAVTWGSTVHEKGGESLAFDIGLGEKKGIVVWDEDGPNVGLIQVSTFDVGTPANATPPRTISSATTDAESPRLLPREGGGYWLAYIARSGGEEDYDARYVAEEIGFRWIEVAQLDANGSPLSSPRAATPKDGHVMVFDMAEAPGGGATLVYRYDDTPSGSSGGNVMRVSVHPSVIDPPAVIVEGDVGPGVPTILPGWLAVLDAAEATKLAPIGPAGDLTAPLVAEPEVGSGEPLALGPGGVLVARPSGRSVKLAVVKCVAPAPDN